MTETRELLYSLGVTEKYVGFFYAACAVELYRARLNQPLFVTKEIYPNVAKRYQTSWQAVERDIRTVRNVIWTQNRPHLERLAGRPLTEKPATVQLLHILASALPSKGENGGGQSA